MHKSITDKYIVHPGTPLRFYSFKLGKDVYLDGNAVKDVDRLAALGDTRFVLKPKKRGRKKIN